MLAPVCVAIRHSAGFFIPHTLTISSKRKPRRWGDRLERWLRTHPLIVENATKLLRWTLYSTTAKSLIAAIMK